MKNILLFITLLTFSFSLKSQDSVISLGKAYKEGILSLEIKGKGGFTGNVILMKIKNLFSAKKRIRIEAGRRLDSRDSSQQDILIVKSQICELDPYTEKIIDVYGMCCQRYNGSPRKESVFEIGDMADSVLVKLAVFIDKHNFIESNAAQNAVWILSDGCRFEGIHGDNKNEQKLLQKYVSELLNIPIPWYTLEYAPDSLIMFSHDPIFFEGNFDYEISTNSLLSMGFYTEKGNLLWTIFYEVAHNPGKYSQFVKISVAVLPKGTYYVKLFADGNLVKMREVIL